MTFYLLITALIIFALIFMNRMSDKIGIPALLAFIGLGMIFGTGKFVEMSFATYSSAETICSVALIFIMFYGGYGTNWKEAKNTAPQAILMSTVGVLITAAIVGFFCHFIMGFGLIESFLIGSVLSSTDAASVFAILRSKKLNLKFGTAPILEVESGSNDPVAYMLTAIFITIYQGQSSTGSILYMIFAQLVFGLAFGFGIAFLTKWLIKKRLHNIDASLFMIFMVGIAIAAYAAPIAVGGNGYLSVYIVGVVLGNQKIKNKVSLVHFFDGITTFMQMLIFFLLGLLADVGLFPRVIIPALIIAVFLAFIARPIATLAILKPFKAKMRQIGLVSWSGLRGASSIVFAITVMIAVKTENDIFHIAFIVVLFSIFIQGSLLPKISEKLGMIDDNEDIMKTFNDYVEEIPVQFIQFSIPKGHGWDGKKLMDITMPPETIIVMIRRLDNVIVPNGNTVLSADDKVVISAQSLDKAYGVELTEIIIKSGDEYENKKLSQVPPADGGLVILIKRGDDVIIPDGDVILQAGDIMVVNYPEGQQRF